MLLQIYLVPILPAGFNHNSSNNSSNNTGSTASAPPLLSARRAPDTLANKALLPLNLKSPKTVLKTSYVDDLYAVNNASTVKSVPILGKPKVSALREKKELLDTLINKGAKELLV